jgi:uncharacterized protein YgiM (DUF1202 family)
MKIPTSPKRYEPARPSTQARPQSKSNGSTPFISLGTCIVTEKTSLRQSATHESSILRRLDVGEEVVVLEHTNQYWWKVVHYDKTGWVKKALLREK